MRKFHSIAALCGDGLRPELKSLFDRLAIDSRSELFVRDDGGPSRFRPCFRDSIHKNSASNEKECLNRIGKQFYRRPPWGQLGGVNQRGALARRGTHAGSALPAKPRTACPNPSAGSSTGSRLDLAGDPRRRNRCALCRPGPGFEDLNRLRNSGGWHGPARAIKTIKRLSRQ
jgi:hypothetical protein